MSVEYRIETYDKERTELGPFLERLPWFERTENGRYRFFEDITRNTGMADAEVVIGDDFIFVEVNGSRNFGATVLGLVSTHLLSMNDHVVVSEV